MPRFRQTTHDGNVVSGDCGGLSVPEVKTGHGDVSGDVHERSETLGSI